MGDGERNAEGPDNGRPLPPDDRIWRHPAEVAMDARHRLAQRRSRRVRAGASVVGGTLVIVGLVWLGTPERGDVTDVADPILLGTADEPPVPTTDPTALAADPASTSPITTNPVTTNSLPTNPGTSVPITTSPVTSKPVDPVTSTSAAELPPTLREIVGRDTILVRSASSGEALAGALTVRAGYLATSGDALGDEVDLVVTWGTFSEPGTVIGHDVVTDLAIIRVGGAAPGVDLVDAPVVEGDEVSMSNENGDLSTHRVVAAASTSEKADGELMVGIVELDGRLGDVPPGSPAYDLNGDVVGLSTATAHDAPAAIIPIGLAREVAGEIIDIGWATHPRLGVVARDIDDELDRHGSLITSVSVDGPADVGGMREGDLVTLIDHHSIASMASMVATLRSYEPGDIIDIVVWRDEGEVSCRVELSSFVDAEA